jgi:hypothetical protein
MAKTFEILDNDDEYRDDCPLGIIGVYKQEYLEKDFEEKMPPRIQNMEYEDQLKWAYKVLKANNAKPKHGDVIWIGGSDNYRNEGIHFWDAKNEKIVPMATKICDYGHVPKTFVVGKGEGEFRSDHWDNISYYNNLEPVWSSKKKWFYASNHEYETDDGTDSE